MATAAQIRETAAENLGILGEGETLPDYESDDLDKAYNEVYNELQGLNLAPWPIATVPSQYAQPVSVLVAEHRALKYGIPVERYQQVQVEAQKAMTRLRELQAGAKQTTTRMVNF